MINYLKISFGIFLVLVLSRFIPHPPNFTSLIALSFYIPLVFGMKFMPILILSFIFTDMIIGFHNLTLFTWGSVLIIGYISNFFNKSLLWRVLGSLIGACLFFTITNFGVWILGQYPYTIEGLLLCYTLAIPFFSYSLISTFIFSGIIEGLLKFRLYKDKFISFKNN